MRIRSSFFLLYQLANILSVCGRSTKFSGNKAFLSTPQAFLLSRNLSFRGGDISTRKSDEDILELVQVQVVHRHGDRTPITPLSDPSYWETTLPSESLLEKISENTDLIRSEGETPPSHAASGNGPGPFGKLSTLGILQMVEVGTTLREKLMKDFGDELKLSDLDVTSTDFPRTIQSVQALLLGLFPNNNDSFNFGIDVRHTDIMIPDPQPRRTPEQAILERELIQRQYMVEKEKEMKGLAIRVSDILRSNNILCENNGENISYGVGEEAEDIDEKTNHNNHNKKPLAWAKLAEITKCLHVREKLPKEISLEELQLISQHTVWKWLELLKHERLAYLAMRPMVRKMIENASGLTSNNEEKKKLYIFSGHDSTLIGLIGAFQLEQPTSWPEYGSVLKMELLQSVKTQDYFVRFSLNDTILKSRLGGEEGGEAQELVSWEFLSTFMMI